MELRKFIAPEIVYGNESRKLVGQYMSNFGVDRIMLISDPIVSCQMWFQDIVDSLDAAEVEWILETGVSINPRDYECHTIAETYQQEKCELILAVGGGSVIDCAKGVGVLVSNGGHISEYEGVDEIMFPIPPLICIPSTSGSAAEISQFAIITNTDLGYKMALVSKTLVPDLALMDPETTYTKPADITIDTGLDVLAHATEAMVSNASSPLTDLHAKEAVRLVLQWLPLAVREPLNPKAREGMLRASMSAGLAFSNASLGLVHAVAHALGGKFDLIHGELNGLLLSSVVAFNYEYAKKQYQVLESICQEILHIDQEQPLYVTYQQFIDNVRKNRPLSEQGADWEGLMAMIPWVIHDPCIATNPRDVSSEDVKTIYEQIW
ncbi:MAG: iron-containing alcohol dehydrogenase [Clostridia bacterium]|nr:iron-containing alcohol dehydrogenase [Clostridia bacterium]